MTTATFYKNGYSISGHTRKDICSELSMFTWAVVNIMQNIEQDGEYVWDEVTGYGHFTFNYENQTLAHIFSVATKMLPVWAKKYYWDGFVEIIVKDELFLPQASNSTESPNEVEAEG